VGGI
jgi:hypothetical protein